MRTRQPRQDPFVQWADANDFQTKLLEVLRQELGLNDLDDIRGFNAKLGAVTVRRYDYFNATRDGNRAPLKALKLGKFLVLLGNVIWGQ